MNVENKQLAQRVVSRAVLALVMLFVGLSQAAAAESLAGDWNGVFANFDGILTDKTPANIYDFKVNKWKIPITQGGVWRGAKFIEATTAHKTLMQLGDWSDMKVEYTNKSINLTGTFSFDFEARKLTITYPKNTLVFTYSQEGDYEYLRNISRGSGPTWVSIVEFARPYDGAPLKRPGAPAAGGSFFAAEDGGIYTLKHDEFYFAADGKGVISKKDADEDARKWKLEAAPEAFANSFRIVPVGQNDHCLEPGDDGALRLVAKEDKAEGEQYWRFEKKGDGYLIVNVKMGGRGLHIEDKGNGHTIIRSRNEAEAWILEKQ